MGKSTIWKKQGLRYRVSPRDEEHMLMELFEEDFKMGSGSGLVDIS